MGNDNSDPIRWEGNQAFFITGTHLEDNTIRIEGDHSKEECKVTLTLPTLCITYADMKFANEIGGVQKDYPDSEEYGLRFFDPPIEIIGHKNVEELTWIRGAEKVSIGPKETQIQWWKARTLVIPRLRIKSKQKVPAKLEIPKVIIPVYQPLIIKVMQYSNGRHVGGIQVTKRHPKWKPTEEKKSYDLWVRVIDGHTRRAIKEANVTLLSITNEGQFVLVGEWLTNDMGIASISELEISNKSLLRIEQQPWHSQFWRFRSHPGQKVRRTFKLWSGKSKQCIYEWNRDDRLEQLAKILGISSKTLLSMNKLKEEKAMKPGMKVKFPCLDAIYYPEGRDRIEDLVTLFCYNDIPEIARPNKLKKPYQLNVGQGIRLPGWNFVKVGKGVKFELLDKLFGQPKGWTRPAQRILHDDPQIAYYRELVAIPTPEFIKKHKPTKWFEMKRGVKKKI